MNKSKIIKILSQLICEIVDRDELQIEHMTKDRKLKLRQFERLVPGSNELNVLDITIEF